MFSFVDFCLFLFLHFFILVMPETNGPITYDKTIDIVYRYEEKITREWITITVRLQDPFDCMKWAGLKYVSTDNIVISTNLENATQKHMHLNLELLDTYNTSGILIIFNDTESNTLAQERLFNFNHSYSRGLDEKHICLTHCIIIFNIKKVLKKYCSGHGFFNDQCCQSDKISLPQISLGHGSKIFLKHEKAINGVKSANYMDVFHKICDVEMTNRNSKEESVLIDIFPNEPKFYYKPDIKYTFKCNASRLPKNMHLLLTLKEAQGNKINWLSKSEGTLLEESLSLREKYNTSKIYCEISLTTKPYTLYIKSTEITLFLKESKTQQNITLQQDDAFYMNKYYIGLTSILLVSCLSVGVILYFYNKFRAKHNALQDTTVYTYATQQEVLYAQLQLDLNKSHSVPRKNERIPYTTIAGVLKPSNQNREK